MVSVIIPCPHCEEVERVRRYGRTRSGSERCYCNVCRRAFALNPKPITLSDHKRQAILRQGILLALQEKTPITAIARTLQTSPNTVYALLKKT